MSIISLGGPGNKIMTLLLPAGTAMPGAVPTKLGRTVAPSGIRACLILLSVIVKCLAAKNFLMIAKEFSSSFKGKFRVLATTSAVISPLVGPSPPVVTTISARLNASCKTSAIRTGLSPTVV